MATLDTLAKQQRRHPLKAPCLHLAKRYFNCQKTKGAGFKPPREAARSLQVSRFCFEILGAGGRSRELLPDVTAIYGLRLSEFAAKRIDAQWG